MGSCSSKSNKPENADGALRRKVSFSPTNRLAHIDAEGDDDSEAHVTNRLIRAPTVNRVIVFKSALADSSDEDKSEAGESVTSQDIVTESSTRSLNSDLPMEEDEKRETPFQFEWMKDLPRSPAEKKKKEMNDALEAEACRKASEAEEALERLKKEDRDRKIAGYQDPKAHAMNSRSLRDLLDHKPPPTDKLLFVNFNKLKFDTKTRKYRTELPRNPEDEDLAEAILESPTFNRPRSFMIFVSHEWIGDDIEGQKEKGRRCDTPNNDKFQLLIKAIEKAWTELAPGMAECYVWCDHMCLNQDKDVGAYTGVSLLNLNLCNIMRLCDIVLTPIVDLPADDHGGAAAPSEWEYSKPLPPVEEVGKVLCGRDGVDWFTEYKSPAFCGYSDDPNNRNGYLKRAWCRLEMLCNAKVPLLEEWIRMGFANKKDLHSTCDADIIAARIEYEKDVVVLRHSAFKGSLLESAKHGMRPHYLFGTKEWQGSHPLIKLPRLTKERSLMLRAMDGDCYDEEVDKTLIHALLEQIDATVAPFRKQGVPEWWQRDMYTGERDKNGHRHGLGTYVWPDNSRYTGPWIHDVRCGDNGTLSFPNGDTLVGSFRNDRHISFCTYTNLRGDVYYGELNDRLEKHGQGKMQYINGDKYEGYWQGGLRHYKGKFTYKEGDEFIGFFRNNKMNGYGTWQYIDGGEYAGYFKNNRRHGEGTFKSAEGISFTGTYRNGRKHGKGITMYKDGTIMECEFVKGEQVGSGKWARPGDAERDEIMRSSFSSIQEGNSECGVYVEDDRDRLASVDILPQREFSVDIEDPPPDLLDPAQVTPKITRVRDHSANNIAGSPFT